ncbi:MAG: hypothetical protein JO022_15185 [Acidobacteriaceae bacterium]|nr:hypothetical protein [Acidobacteriaceae bacterium]
MKIVSKAPCRVDLAGGTLDIWPLYLNHPGAVTVNFAVDRYTTCVLETRSTPEIILHSRDLDTEESYTGLDELRGTRSSRLPLPAYVLKFFGAPSGVHIETDSESPAGAGISGSSALIIAIASALNQLNETGYTLEKIREIAQNIEAQIIRVPTGCQDYYPAMYGGVNAIELGCAGITRHEIPIDLDDFNERIVLAYTGEPRNSGINNWEVIKAYVDGDRAVHRNFDQIAAIATAMRDAVARQDWTETGRLLREEWMHRRMNAPGISTPLIDELVAVSRHAGSTGAKVCGAGGGGCVLMLVERGASKRVQEVVERVGATVLPVRVACQGVQVSICQQQAY